jgi:hypothetical protein
VLTNTVTFAVALHPPTVTVTVYGIFDAGLTRMLALVDPLLHLYVPPPLAVSVVESPLHIVSFPLILAFIALSTVTFTVTVSRHPDVPSPTTEYVVATVGVAVTTGPDVALKPVAGIHVYDAAPLAFKLTPGPLAHMLAADGVTVTAGVALTVIVTVAVPVHVPLLPVTVYVVVVAGLAVTVAPTVALKPVAGAQLYVAAPLAVKLVPPPPEHMFAEVGVTLTVGAVFTVIVTVCVPLQGPFIPVTVYVVVTVGVAVTDDPLVALKPAAGAHV